MQNENGVGGLVEKVLSIPEQQWLSIKASMGPSNLRALHEGTGHMSTKLALITVPVPYCRFEDKVS